MTALIDAIWPRLELVLIELRDFVLGRHPNASCVVKRIAGASFPLSGYATFSPTQPYDEESALVIVGCRIQGETFIFDSEVAGRGGTLHAEGPEIELTLPDEADIAERRVSAWVDATVRFISDNRGLVVELMRDPD